jgi:hypothetical protein
MYTGLAGLLEEATEDDGVRVVLLQGAGRKKWSKAHARWFAEQALDHHAHYRLAGRDRRNPRCPGAAPPYRTVDCRAPTHRSLITVVLTLCLLPCTIHSYRSAAAADGSAENMRLPLTTDITAFWQLGSRRSRSGCRVGACCGWLSGAGAP